MAGFLPPTHLAAVVKAASVLLKMLVASGSAPELYTAFTTWLSHDWCMLSIILSASSMILENKYGTKMTPTAVCKLQFCFVVGTYKKPELLQT